MYFHTSDHPNSGNCCSLLDRFLKYHIILLIFFIIPLSNKKNLLQYIYATESLHCHDMCKILLWSVKHILNKSTANFGQNLELDQNIINGMGAWPCDCVTAHEPLVTKSRGGKNGKKLKWFDIFYIYIKIINLNQESFKTSISKFHDDNAQVICSIKSMGVSSCKLRNDHLIFIIGIPIPEKMGPCTW